MEVQVLFWAFTFGFAVEHMGTGLDWKSRATSPEQVVSLINSNTKIFVQGAAATPTELLLALSARSDLEHIRLYHLHLEGQLPFASLEQSSRYRSVSLFTSAALRQPIAQGWAEFMPIFLSDIPELFRSGAVNLDLAIIQVSPPDRHGLCSLGTSVDATRSAVDQAKIVIAQINPQVPRTHGNTLISLSDLDAYTLVDRPLIEAKVELPTPAISQIGELVAGLVEDRSTLQIGLGAIPDAVLLRLRSKADLGVHTEMFSDGLVDLVKAGAITNRYKKVHPGVIITSFVNGTKKVFDFVDDNPQVHFLPCDRTNDTSVIRKNDRVVALNSALQIDLTGQVCADSLGHSIYSGIGGQMDFIRAAALSHQGKPIIAMLSTARAGAISRIVSELSPGAGVVTTRGHVHWVVTEYGAVNLHGRTLRERADLLISIAHPDFRSELTAQVAEIRHFV